MTPGVAFLTLATKGNVGLAGLSRSVTTSPAADECGPGLKGSLQNVLK